MKLIWSGKICTLNYFAPWSFLGKAFAKVDFLGLMASSISPFIEMIQGNQRKFKVARKVSHLVDFKSVLLIFYLKNICDCEVECWIRPSYAGSCKVSNQWIGDRLNPFKGRYIQEVC